MYTLIKKKDMFTLIQSGIEPEHITVKVLCLNHLTIGSHKNIEVYI